MQATLGDRASLAQAVDGVDAVIHLASLLKVPWKAEFYEVNVEGTRRLLKVCADRSTPPVFIFVSSLAAAGPAEDSNGCLESHRPNPVSVYGRTKLAAEMVVNEFATRMPCSIIRPPLVYGPGDVASRPLFQSTARGVHVVPRWSPMRLSTIFVKDLCSAIECVTVSGKRRPSAEATNPSEGIYFAAADEVTTYAQLGRRVGAAAGQKNVRVVRVPSWISFVGACVSEFWARLLDTRQILNRDKWREATAGDWVCSAERLKSELGWRPSQSLDASLRETAHAYADAGLIDDVPPEGVR